MKNLTAFTAIFLALFTSQWTMAQLPGEGDLPGGDGLPGGGGNPAFFEAATMDGSHVGERTPPGFDEDELPTLNPTVQIATGIDGLAFRQPVKLQFYDSNPADVESAGPFLWHEALYEIEVQNACEKLVLVQGERITIDFRITLLDSIWAPQELYCMWDWQSDTPPVVFDCPLIDGAPQNGGRPGDWVSQHIEHFVSFPGFTEVSFNYAYCDYEERDYRGILQDTANADRKEGIDSQCVLVTNETDNNDIVVTRLTKPCAYVTGQWVFEYVGPTGGTKPHIQFASVAEEATGSSNVRLTWADGEDVDEQLGVAAGIFYNDSAYDDGDDEEGAIAPDKEPLFDGRTAEFENYTSYTRGINGIMVDVWNLDRDAVLEDFTFRQGNTNNVDEWEPAPNPIEIRTELGQGTNNSDRIWLIWEDNEIENIWLQVTMPEFRSCGPSGFRFYFGNIIAETGAGDSGVNVFDLLVFRRDFSDFTDIYSASDFDRNGHVGIFDLLPFRRHFGTQLVDLITPTSKN